MADLQVLARGDAHHDAPPLAVAPLVVRGVAEAVLRAQLLRDAVVDGVELGERVGEVHLPARVLGERGEQVGGLAELQPVAVGHAAAGAG